MRLDVRLLELHVAVVLEQVHPGRHPHHVADEERREEPGEEERAPAARVPRDEVGERVPDRERDDRREADEQEGPQDALEVQAARLGEVRQRERHRDSVPLRGVPDGDGRAEHGVERSEGDAEDGVEGDDEQDEQHG